MRRQLFARGLREEVFSVFRRSRPQGIGLERGKRDPAIITIHELTKALGRWLYRVDLSSS
ncbi:transcriptional regulator [Labrys sp. KNU-23]|nr:transcriptional regulator [Labrys sp. KNU-23]